MNYLVSFYNIFYIMPENTLQRIEIAQFNESSSIEQFHQEGINYEPHE